MADPTASRRSAREESVRPSQTRRRFHQDPGLGPLGWPVAHASVPSLLPPIFLRGWWNFGSGVLGDIGCHEFSPVFKALKLHDRHPDWIEACSSNDQWPPEIASESAPLSSIIHWHFPAKDSEPELLLGHMVGRGNEALFGPRSWKATASLRKATG